MKTVFPKDEIFHLWANRTHNHRTRNSNDSVSAEGNLLFSYRECIAILSDTGAIVSSYKWSVTTSAHQSLAARAVSGNVVYLPCKFPYDGDLKALARNARSEGLSILKCIDRDNKARTINAAIGRALFQYYTLTDFAHTVDGLGEGIRATNLAEARLLRDGLLKQDYLTRCNQLAGRLVNKITGMQNVVKNADFNNVESAYYDAVAMPENVKKVKDEFIKYGLELPDYLDKLVKQSKKLLPELKKLNNERLKKLNIENAEKIALWRNSEYVNMPQGLPPMLRIKKGLLDDGELGKDSIQTSWGASVPLTVAPFLWSMIVKAIETKTESNHNIEVGNYTLEKVFSDGSIKVGCHVIAYSELEGIAKQLNYI